MGDSSHRPAARSRPATQRICRSVEHRL